MAFLAAAAPFAALAGGLIKGVGGALAGHAQKKSDYRAAREEALAGNEQERQARIDARRQIGQQLAAQYDNGLEGGSGTALDALRESQIEAALDAMEIRRQGASKAAALRAHGRQAETAGYLGAASDILGGATQFGQMRSDWAQARTGTSA